MTVTDPAYAPDRRPIRSRDRALSIRTAAWLAQRGASPNAISTAGMIAGILAGAAFAGTRFVSWSWLGFLAAAACMQLRLLANMFDGMVALQTGRASPVGELYNEVPDRVSDTAILIGAGYAVGGMPELGYLAAIAALFTAYVRAQGKAAGAPQEFCGPMAKPQRMALLTASAVLAAIVPQNWWPHVSAHPEQGIIALALLLIVIGGVITTLRRLGRIARSLRKS
ncbi:MAG TPA: CDP-alcohol phosphatidyltransferase family protein [Planctomycetaceae bacterium]|jgi:phosphatidylglycerophosphate synthase|nr:CDP-alcohol phosphatidyltransferase family protein [Planctomycetaceae bacterium]